MAMYRYRTEALIGPWRECAWEAECDAVAAHLAQFDDPQFATIRWLVKGEIERFEGDARSLRQAG